MLMRSKSQF